MSENPWGGALRSGASRADATKAAEDEKAAKKGKKWEVVLKTGPGEQCSSLERRVGRPFPNRQPDKISQKDHCNFRQSGSHASETIIRGTIVYERDWSIMYLKCLV